MPKESLLVNLEDALIKVRSDAERLVNLEPVSGEGLQWHFLRVLASVSKLYSLSIELEISDLQSVKGSSAERIHLSGSHAEAISNGIVRLFADSELTNKFIPNGPFSAKTGLYTVSDYEASLSSNLPDIYEESQRTSAYLHEYQSTRRFSTLGRLEVSLEHAAKYHVCFLIPALQRLAAESSWKIS